MEMKTLEERNRELEMMLVDRTTHILNLKRWFGRTFEKFAPFTTCFPGRKEDTVFVGKPIDFIVFSQDSIKFVEVKTNGAWLTDNELRIQKMVEERKVEFIVLRYPIIREDS